MADSIEHLLITGDLLAAQLAADKAYADSAPSDGAWAAYFLAERGRINLYRGDNTQAVALLTPELSSFAATGVIVRRDVVLALARFRLGDLPGANKALAAAEAIHSQGAPAAELLAARGIIAVERGQLTESEPLFRAALEVAEHSNPDQDASKFQQTQILMDLGVVALKQQHFEDALDRFQRASTIAQSIGAKLAEQAALGNLGFVYYRTGDFLRARDTSRMAAAQAAMQGASLNQAASLNNAGDSAFQLNDLATARALYEQSLALAQKLQSPEKIFDAHQALGYLLLHSDPALAAVHIHEATRLAAERNHPGGILEQQFVESLLLAQQNQPQQAIAMLRRFDAQPGALPSLYWQAESTLAKLYDQQGDAPQAEFWFRRALSTFSEQRLMVHSVELQLPFLGNGDDLYFAYMDHLIRQQKTAEALDLLDRSRAETLADGLDRDRQTAARKHHKTVSPTVSPRAIAARLNATILVFCVRPNESYLWAITPARQTFYRLPGRETLLPLIKRHSQAILASTDLLARRESTGRQLYDLLVKPAAGDLQRTLQAGSRVFIIADRELNDLNFETLIPPPGKSPDKSQEKSQDKPHYWIEDVTITNARSLRLLAASSTPMPHKQTALLIGDPIYRDTEYPALPNAATEMNGIAQHFPTAARTVFSGARAVPAAYAASSPGAFSYIHFVAHATSNETSPLDSAIVLSKSETQPFAYRLYARDILDQRLHANLVTISACYGSGRRNYSGEGLVGLAWAFLRAGAHNVIGALWQVSDASTPILMDRLYTDLLAGEPPDAALRAAKLATIHAGGAFRKPLYWAPFQIYSGS